jgi:hypothetical protein
MENGRWQMVKTSACGNGAGSERFTIYHLPFTIQCEATQPEW